MEIVLSIFEEEEVAPVQEDSGETNEFRGLKSSGPQTKSLF